MSAKRPRDDEEPYEPDGFDFEVPDGGAIVDGFLVRHRPVVVSAGAKVELRFPAIDIQEPGRITIFSDVAHVAHPFLPLVVFADWTGLRVWDMASRCFIRDFPPTVTIDRPVFDPAGRRLLVVAKPPLGALDRYRTQRGKVLIVDFDTTETVHELTHVDHGHNTMAWNPSGTLVAVVKKGTIVIFDAATGAEALTIRSERAIDKFVVHPTEDLLACSTEKRTLEIFRWSGEPVGVVHVDHCTHTFFNHDLAASTKWIVLGLVNKQMTVFNWAGEQVGQTRWYGYPRAFDASGSTLVIGGREIIALDATSDNPAEWGVKHAKGGGRFLIPSESIPAITSDGHILCSEMNFKGRERTIIFDLADY